MHRTSYIQILVYSKVNIVRFWSRDESSFRTYIDPTISSMARLYRVLFSLQREPFATIEYKVKI